MLLCESIPNMMNKWKGVFAQERTLMKAIRLALCMLLNPSRSTITQSLIYGGLDKIDWSAVYNLFSRSKWNDADLFKPVIEETISYFPDSYISLAVDDTKIKKTGKKIPSAQFFMDPLSPPFRYNLIYGHRLLQFSALLPLYQQEIPDPDNEDKLYHVSRGIPVSLSNVPAVKKPGKNATDEDIKNYNLAKSKNNLSLTFIDNARKLRDAYDEKGASDKTLLVVADGSFCNSTVFKSDIPRTKIAARCRKDARLCYRDETPSRRIYSKESFTPLSVRQDDDIPYQKVKLYIGKKLRKVRYKEVRNVLWQRGAGQKELRLLVIAPKPYKSGGGKRHYKQEAYLLTDDHDLSAEVMIQQYINRWEIEVNHRDEKNNLGLGQAQVWNKLSIIKVPALLVATYSIMLLMSLRCYGLNRSDNYLPQPKWRKGSVRPSCNDLVNQLRKELSSDKSLQDRLKINLNQEVGMVVNQ